MSSVIQNLLQQTVGDGARSSKFECLIYFKNTALFPINENIIALVKTSQFPGKNHDTIDFKYKGRSVPIKGQVKYNNTWTCTFYLTEDHALKKAFEDWIESLDEKMNIKEIDTTVQNAQYFNSTMGTYTSLIKIAQLDFTGGQETIVYTLYDCFPKSVSSVNVDYSNQGPILEFTVEFVYSYYDSVVTKTILGSLVDELKGKTLGVVSSIIGGAKNQISGIFESIAAKPLEIINTGVTSALTSVSSSLDAVNNMFTKISW